MNDNVVTAPAPRGIFGTKVPASVCFAVALVLFFLPFAEFKCSGSGNSNSFLNLSSMNFSVSNSGLGLALGLQWKVNTPFGDLGARDTDKNWKKELDSPKPNNYALVAFILAIVATALSFARARVWAFVNAVAGIGAAAALIGLMIDLKHKTGDMTSDMGKGANALGSDNSADIALVFTPWFYITIIALIVASFFSYRRAQLTKS